MTHEPLIGRRDKSFIKIFLQAFRFFQSTHFLCGNSLNVLSSNAYFSRTLLHVRVRQESLINLAYTAALLADDDE